MWRTWIAVLFIAALIIGGIFCLNYTDNICDKIEHHLLQTLYNVQVLKQDNSESLLQAHKIWEENSDILCMFITHDRVEGISACFQRAFAFFEMGEFAEYNAQLRELLASLQYIRYYDKPTLPNIF